MCECPKCKREMKKVFHDSNDDMAITDYNFYEEEKVCVTKIMIIYDDPLCPSEPYYPF